MAPSAASSRVSPFAVLFVLGLSVLCVAPGALYAEDPPAELHFEGDHWTAWKAPAEVPEGAEVYTIQPGDTLWDLAAQFLGDPYLWPQLWERNQYILDAHWIYPGDGLVVSVEVVPVDALADATPSEPVEPEAVPVEPMDEPRSMFARSNEPPSPLGSETDIYCSGFIGADGQQFPYEIVGSEAAALAPSIYGARKKKKTIETTFGVVNTLKNDLASPDIVYVDGGSNAGMTAGSMFMMVEELNMIRHPVTQDRVGRFYRYLGRLRVLSVQEETAIAEITDSCHPARIGAKLMPFVAEPVPLRRRTPMRPVNQPASNDTLAEAPTIIHADYNLLSMGQGNVVFIDRGEAHDVTPGDIFTIYRMNTPDLPAVVMGELAVLSVHEETSVARILSSRYTVRLGDRLDVK